MFKHLPMEKYWPKFDFSRKEIDWLQFLKQVFINVSYHGLEASLFFFFFFFFFFNL